MRCCSTAGWRHSDTWRAEGCTGLLQHDELAAFRDVDE